MNVMAESNTGVTYLLDVRSEHEYEAGHVAGSINVPGGQAVQRADDFVAVRNGRIIFISNQASRAMMEDVEVPPNPEAAKRAHMTRLALASSRKRTA